MWQGVLRAPGLRLQDVVFHLCGCSDGFGRLLVRRMYPGSLLLSVVVLMLNLYLYLCMNISCFFSTKKKMCLALLMNVVPTSLW